MVASWYGRQFHGKPTASGEIFDMNAPTAAHKKLPFGTKLLVINPDNEKSTTVTITDRGPYIWGRELDLSYKAASDIGMIGAGVATVKVVFLGTDHKYDNYITEKIEVGTAMVDPKDISSPLTVQIGTFKDNLNAIRMKIAVKERYESTEIFEDTVDGKKYFKVRVGKFNSKKQAQLLADNLSDEGYETIILRYK
jgi:rare lipoprotein A